MKSMKMLHRGFRPKNAKQNNTKTRTSTLRSTTAFIVTEVSESEEPSIEQQKVVTASSGDSDIEQNLTKDILETTIELNETCTIKDINETLEQPSSAEDNDEEINIPVTESEPSSSNTTNKTTAKRTHSQSEGSTNIFTNMDDRNAQVVFECLSSKEYRLHLKPDAKIYFHGKVNIRVLSGHVFVLGWHLYEGDEKQIFSPRGTSLLGIEAQSLPCVLELSPFTSHLAASLNSVLPLQLFTGRKEISTPLPSSKVKVQAERYLNCRFFSDSRSACGKVTTISEPWKKTVDEICRATNFYDNTRTVVFGGKGVGKSTFVRLLTNSLLSKQRENRMDETRSGVVVIDFDPGQAEFTAPGCLSAMLVKQPLLGPGYTHQLCPQRTMFLGQVDVSRCSREYKESLRDLVEFCARHYLHIPWVINTMGFNSGLGVELMYNVMQEVQSARGSHVHAVQIKSKDSTKNYPHGFLCDNIESSFCHYSVMSGAETQSRKQQQQWGLPARQLREIALMAYLSPALKSPSFSLMPHEPYVTKLDDMTLGVVHRQVEPWLVLRALIGNLVGMCHVDPRIKAQTIRPSDRPGPSILQHPVALPCFGYGVVCGVDVEAGQLFLQTPEPCERMKEVNCLLLGAVQLPSTVRTTGETSDYIPYVSTGKGQETSAPVRRFYRPIASFTPKKG